MHYMLKCVHHLQLKSHSHLWAPNLRLCLLLLMLSTAPQGKEWPRLRRKLLSRWPLTTVRWDLEFKSTLNFSCFRLLEACHVSTYRLYRGKVRDECTIRNLWRWLKSFQFCPRSFIVVLSPLYRTYIYIFRLRARTVVIIRLMTWDAYWEQNLRR